MTRIFQVVVLVSLLALAGCAGYTSSKSASQAPKSPVVMTNLTLPKEWVDKDTGHRVVRLSEEPGSESLYFHQNGYSTDGRLIFSVPNGIAAVDLQTRKIEKIFEGRVRIIMVGRKTG